MEQSTHQLGDHMDPGETMLRMMLRLMLNIMLSLVTKRSLIRGTI
ncbi:unnamed protein product [Linum tenue]|uniref:Uncharacterized protein n=1 Tax=Linum tenue TaxID=586396 RepID=A0AAV0L6T8_9ROSI|nr:unnamed protein product [Linum tenue]